MRHLEGSEGMLPHENFYIGVESVDLLRLRNKVHANTHYTCLANAVTISEMRFVVEAAYVHPRLMRK